MLGAPRACQPQELCAHGEQGAGFTSHPLPVEPLPLVHRALGRLHRDRLREGEHRECGGSQTPGTGGSQEGRQGRCCAYTQEWSLTFSGRKDKACSISSRIRRLE